MPRGRNEGSIHKHKRTGLWTAQISLGYDAQGKRIRRTVYGKTKGEVKEKLLKLQGDALNGLPVKPENITLRDFVSTWLQDQQANVRPSTLSKYQYHLGHILPVLGHRKLRDVTFRQISAFYARLEQNGLGPRTVFDIASTLRAVLKDASDKGVVPRNEAKLVKRKSPKSKARSMTPEELRAFLVASRGERLHDAFVVLLNTGLRPGEWLGLSWSDVDLGKRTLSVRQALHEHKAAREGDSLMYLAEPKTKAGVRTIPLSQAAFQALRRWAHRQKQERLAAGPAWNNEHNLVFTNRRGGFMSRSLIVKRDLRRILSRAALVRLADRCGLNASELLLLHAKSSATLVKAGNEVRTGDGRVYTVRKEDLLAGVTLHTFRHTYVSILIAQGERIETISRLVGHERTSITQDIYGHLMPGAEEAAAAKMDAFMESLQSAVDRQ